MIVIGITGSIGMGKTTIASMFKNLNIPIHDADQIVRTLLETNIDVISNIKKKWPICVFFLNGIETIDKIILSDIIFKDVLQKKKLENIIHPHVLISRENFLRKNLTLRTNIVGLDVPLLYETNTDKICDYIFLANASLKSQKERVTRRKNMTFEKFKTINNNQMSLSQKLKKTPIIISTDFGKIYTFILVVLNLLKILILFKVKK